MIKSMTGYGRHKECVSGFDITVEVRSVNSRYLDCTVKISRIYSAFEEKLKKLVSDNISRGKVDVYVSVESTEGDKVELSLNREYLEGYLKALETVKRDYGIKGELDINTLAQKNEIFLARKADDELDTVWEAVKTVADKAFADFDTMRVTEGAKLKEDLSARMATLESYRQKLLTAAPGVSREYYAKMTERVKTLLGGVEVDEGRLLTECAVYADKCDVTEELVRLSSHLSQFADMLGYSQPVGKKMDFLLQEINREINTTGSKCNDKAMTAVVVDAKAEAEKIREQIQNIE